MVVLISTTTWILPFSNEATSLHLFPLQWLQSSWEMHHVCHPPKQHPISFVRGTTWDIHPSTCILSFPLSPNAPFALYLLPVLTNAPTFSLLHDSVFPLLILSSVPFSHFFSTSFSTIFLFISKLRSIYLIAPLLFTYLFLILIPLATSTAT